MACTAYSPRVTSAPSSDAVRPRLYQAAVIDRALALADAEGLDGLTIRRLAQQLGVTPMAIYWHFRSKEVLLAGLAERIWGEIDTEVDSEADWPDQLRGLLESLVRVLRVHPSASRLLQIGKWLDSEPALQATEVTLEVLRRAGFDPLHASEVARSTLWTGLMLVMSTPGACDDADQEFHYRFGIDLLIAGVRDMATRTAG